MKLLRVSSKNGFPLSLKVVDAAGLSLEVSLGLCFIFRFSVDGALLGSLEVFLYDSFYVVHVTLAVVPEGDKRAATVRVHVPRARLTQTQRHCRVGAEIKIRLERKGNLTPLCPSVFPQIEGFTNNLRVLGQFFRDFLRVEIFERLVNNFEYRN